MRALVNSREMKAIDERSINEYGIPSIVLMERAALAVAEECINLIGEPAGRRICAVCGTGNNGADGAAAARMLFLKGARVTILIPGEGARESAEFQTQINIARKLSIPVESAGDYIPGKPDLIIDAVFGTGLSRDVEGVYKDMISFINGHREENGAAVVSVDMPSGISSDTGRIMGCAVSADATVTFGEKKIGQALFPGRTACGELSVADIGTVPETEEMRAGHVLSLEKKDLSAIPKRRADSNKGTWGKVLIAAGSKDMAGAVYMAALASYRTGAGLVKVMTVKENRDVILAKLPEALITTYDADTASEDPAGFCEYIKREIGWADVIVLGPGIGTGDHAKTLVGTILSDAYVPMILDADALNIVAKNPRFKSYFTENIIITPHVGEMARLTGKTVDEIKDDPVGTASEFAARYQVTCVLKDAATVTAGKDGKVFINESGSSAMAKAGSGDILTGIIAGLTAIGMEEEAAAAYGVYVHGLAGEAAEKERGIHSVLAAEIADNIGGVLEDGI